MRGRLPQFTREEANKIIADNDALDVLALRYGCSHVTIMRVKSMGRFAGVGYIARDEVGLPDDEKARIRANAPEAPPSKRGRKYATGRYWPLTEEERAAILADDRHASLVAADYQITASYVTRLRTNGRAADGKPTTITKELATTLRDSEEPALKLAADYGVHPRIIEALRAGTIQINQ